MSLSPMLRRVTCGIMFILAIVATEARAQNLSGCQYNSTLPTTPDGTTVAIQCDSSGRPAIVTGSSKHLVSSTLTKISGAGTYTGATTTAPHAICLFASATACAPLTMTVSSTATVTGYLTGLMLVKSTTGATAATFRVFVFKAAPTLTAVFNDSVYLVPIADITSGAYVGSWECSTQTVNTDNGYYDCSANRPIGYNQFNLTDGTLRFVVVATGAYVSGSSETFNVIADIAASVP